MFFHYSQNNSGGSFAFDESAGITHHVVVEAPNATEANARAEDIGLYWDGCDTGQDCPCCGDRWYPFYGEGSEEPEVYGQHVAKIKHLTEWMPKGREICVHYADGKKEWF